MITRLAHVCISSGNLDHSLAFYRDGLGFSKAFDFRRDGRIVGFYLAVPGGTFIEIFLRGEIQKDAPAPIQHLCLQVDDLDRTISELRAKGISVSDRKMGADGSWQAWTSDPSGVKIEFHQYTERSSQHTGADCVLK
jgi:catechol 2,3-dioxygenase-like lactoylglutathione lyase family enzyme